MIGLREDQQMKARMVDFLNHTAARCRSELATASPLTQGVGMQVKPAAGSAASKAAG